MLSLSAIAKAEKNKLSTESTFIILLDICLDEVVRVCYNTDDVIWNGNLYQAFPFTIGEIGEDSDGSDPNVELQIDNVSQAMQYIVEESGGGNNTEVILRVVNSKGLDLATAEMEAHFVVQKCTVNQQYITFTLGSEYSARTRRPLNRYMKNNCPFKYKGLRCGATSSLTTCNHTLQDCRTRKNSKRFGGFPGIDQKGVYVSE